jgi:chorismate-pyruvate lyase
MNERKEREKSDPRPVHESLPESHIHLEKMPDRLKNDVRTGHASLGKLMKSRRRAQTHRQFAKINLLPESPCQPDLWKQAEIRGWCSRLAGHFTE